MMRTADLVGRLIQCLRGLWAFFLPVLYPDSCVVCGAVLPFCLDKEDKAAACEACAEILQSSAESMSDKDIFGAMEGRAFLCCFAAYPYEDAARDMILRYKSGGHTAAARDIAVLLTRRFPKETLLALTPSLDLLIPVPSHKSRRKTRGFSPTELVTEYLSAHYGLPYNAAALIITKPTERQRGLNAADRQRNVENAYAVQDAAAIAGKTILLFDDVLTTGATADACAKVLLAAGAKAVYVLVIASTQLKMP